MTALSPPLRTSTLPPPPRSGFWRRRAIRLAAGIAALGAIGASVAIDQSALFVAPVLFLLVVPFEKLFPRHRGQRIRRPHVGLDIRYALTAPLLNAVGLVVAIGIGIGSLAWVPGLALRPLVDAIPTGFQPLAGVVVFDLAIYWAHRWAHEVPALWRFHSVHHSTRHLDWVSGFRNHPFDGAIVAPPFVLLLAAGFEPELAGALAVVQFLLGIFLHANVRFRWRPLHRIVITPEFHHWHHADEIDAHCSNYSVFLPLWDIVFGTYFMPRDRRPARYGVSEPIPMTMRGQLLHPFAELSSPLDVVRHPVVGFRSGRGSLGRVLRDIARSTTRRTRVQGRV